MNRRGPKSSERGAIAVYVLPLAVGIVSPDDEHPLRVGTVEGTGFLVAGGRGLGVTAKHVVKALLAKAPIPDNAVPVSRDAALASRSPCSSTATATTGPHQSLRLTSIVGRRHVVPSARPGPVFAVYLYRGQT